MSPSKEALLKQLDAEVIKFEESGKNSEKWFLRKILRTIIQLFEIEETKRCPLYPCNDPSCICYGECYYEK